MKFSTSFFFIPSVWCNIYLQTEGKKRTVEGWVGGILSPYGTGRTSLPSLTWLTWKTQGERGKGEELKPCWLAVRGWTRSVFCSGRKSDVLLFLYPWLKRTDCIPLPIANPSTLGLFVHINLFESTEVIMWPIKFRVFLLLFFYIHRKTNLMLQLTVTCSYITSVLDFYM